eukprot:TRINITY_DN28999_c0_g1_i1.p1 TRINITY_DN28999_c0_g1~~TRINITY_DN28999_c0_g1_i1.p1  ORF type:complete len:107 (+),score=15.76 TRINITY_DN28999_c0_g1_i1:883-1203(+)
MRNILSCFESINVTHVGPHPNGAQPLVHLAGCMGGRKKVFLDQKQYRRAEQSGDMKVLYYLEIILNNNKKISRKKKVGLHSPHYVGLGAVHDKDLPQLTETCLTLL